MMDIAGIVFGADNTPMTVTDEGRDIAPSLFDYLSDRPLLLNLLTGNWFVEASLAQNADGTQADPVIVRDGDQGRLIPVYQTLAQDDPKGAVAAEIIAWLMRTTIEPTQLGLAGQLAAVTGKPSKLTVRLQDARRNRDARPERGDGEPVDERGDRELRHGEERYLQRHGDLRDDPRRRLVRDVLLQGQRTGTGHPVGFRRGPDGGAVAGERVPGRRGHAG